MTRLVLLHGWGAFGAVWQAQAEYFQARSTVLTPTLPAWDADWLIDYLTELPLPECVLVGWSLGGMVLLEALSGLQGSRPAGLVLVGVAPVFTRRLDYPWGQPPAMVRGMRRGLRETPQKILEKFALQCLAPGEAAFGSQAKAAFASPAAGNLAAGLDYLLTCDLRPLLSGIPAGAVIIQGGEDRIVPLAQGQFLRDHLAGAGFHQLPGTGHLPFMTQAQAFNGIIEECLNKAS